MTASSTDFLQSLKQEIESHPAVNHSLLARLAQVPFTREDHKIFGLQHFSLVGKFTRYLEELLLTAPDSQAKLWISKVLVDEYGEGSDGQDHATLYRKFLWAAGASDLDIEQTRLHEDVVGFVKEHLRICREEPFLVGLGAVGPGHEWAIPKMFPPIVKGLRRAGFAEYDISYFTLHMEQDVDHGNWLASALALYCTDRASQNLIRHGALLSLEARYRFWSGVQDKIVRWRQPENVHLRSPSRFTRYKGNEEITYSSWQEQFLPHQKRNQKGIGI